MSNETRTSVSEVSVEKHATLRENDGDLRYHLDEDVEVIGKKPGPPKVPPGDVDPTPANVMTVAIAPAFATSVLYQSLATTTGQAFENATTAQQSLAMASRAAMTAGVARLSGLAVAATSKVGVADLEALALLGLNTNRGETKDQP